MRLDYVTLDVFTDRRFGGNPLAVVLDADGLDTDAMQTIAREFNYSETTFVCRPSDPAHDFKVRIFTPTMEMPFAGHPNVGTGYLLAERGHGDALAFEEVAGTVRVEALRGPNGVTGARIRAPRRLEEGPEIDAATVAAAVGLEADAILTEPRFLSVGARFAFAEVASLDALGRAVPDAGAFRRTKATLSAATGPDFALFLYVRTETPDRLRARMFAPLDNIPEDPATGSAAAALGAFLHVREGRGAVTIEQGVEMGRPSRIEVAVDAEGIASVAGPCVEVMRGEIEV